MAVAIRAANLGFAERRFRLSIAVADRAVRRSLTAYALVIDLRHWRDAGQA